MPRINSAFTSVLPEGTTSPALDYLSGRFTYRSKKSWEEAIAQNLVLKNGRPVTAEEVLLPRDELTFLVVDYHEPEVPQWETVLAEQENIFWVHKPSGLPVHRTGRILFNTLVNQVRRRFPGSYPLHRLDTETSGIVAFCRPGSKSENSAPQIPLHRLRVLKLYAAVVSGRPAEHRFLVEHSLGTREDSPIRCQMHPRSSGKPARSYGTVVETLDTFSLVILAALTGRRHQLRAHLASLGIPVAGDKIYSHNGHYYLKRLDTELDATDHAALGAPHHLLHHFFWEAEHSGNIRTPVFDFYLPDAFLRYFPVEALTRWWDSEDGKSFVEEAWRLNAGGKA